MSFVESDGRAMVDGKFQPSKVNIPQNLIAGEVIGYEPTGVIQNAMFGMSEDAALNIATGKKGKSTIATMQGSHVPMSPEQAFKMAQEALIDPSFVQVGMDPERHSYFYDRETTQPVVAADLVIQVGPLVLAKNPTFAGKKSFKYSITYPAGINDISQFLTEQEIDEFLVGRKGDIENKAASLSAILIQVSQLCQSDHRNLWLARCAPLHRLACGHIPPDICREQRNKHSQHLGQLEQCRQASGPRVHSAYYGGKCTGRQR